MSKLSIRAEIFPVQAQAVGELKLYQLSLAQDQNFYTLSWQLAYILRRLTGGIWVSSQGRLVGEQSIEANEWPDLLRRCWEQKPELAGVTAVIPLTDPAGPADLARYMAKGVLSQWKTRFEQVLKPHHVRLGPVEVRRQIVINDWVVGDIPCVSLSVCSETVYAHDLAQTLKKYSSKSLIGFKVRGKLDAISGEIGAVVGKLSEHRERLLAFKPDFKPDQVKADAISSGPAEMPVISVKTRKRSYDYPAHLLELVPHPESYPRLGVQGQKVLSAQRLKPEQRWKLVTELAKPIQQAGLLGEAIAQPVSKLGWSENLKLGSAQVCSASDRQLLTRLKQHGLYAATESVQQISTRVIYLCPSEHLAEFKTHFHEFLDLLKLECKSFGLHLKFQGKKLIPLQKGSRGELELSCEQLLKEGKPELVLAIFPQENRLEDLDDQSPSVYRALKQVLLRQGIQSQCLTLDKLIRRDGTGQQAYLRSMTNLVLGILAKTGQVPYVLAEPMAFTDYVVGIDISRKIKQRSSGSTNVAAATRIFRNDGHLFSFHLLPPDAVEGETLSRRVIEELFPYQDFACKRVVIHRDGPYRQNERQHFAAWGKEIGATFHLIEVIKSGNPRIYRSSGSQVGKPAKGDLIRLSETEVLLVSSLPPFDSGTPRPLKIVTDGSLTLDQALESVFKLTLLHYGSQLAPRLPITVHYSDQMAWMAHRGVRPSQSVGAIPYWI